MGRTRLWFCKSFMSINRVFWFCRLWLRASSIRWSRQSRGLLQSGREPWNWFMAGILRVVKQIHRASLAVQDWISFINVCPSRLVEIEDELLAPTFSTSPYDPSKFDPVISLHCPVAWFRAGFVFFTSMGVIVQLGRS
jgi:hypothetical protein